MMERLKIIVALLSVAVIFVMTPYARATTSLDAWIIKLETAESGRRANISIIDRNGKRSAGCLMFQDATFQSYSKRYGTGYELQDIFNCSAQKQLARLILKEKDGWKNWHTSVKKIGLPPQ